MKTIMVVLTAALLGGAGCRQRTTNVDDDERVSAGKPVERSTGDDDFIESKRSFETSVDERLDRLSVRIDQLESRADAAGHDAAVKMRARRDELAAKAKDIGHQAEAGWDQFEANLSHAVDDLEHDVDQLVD